MHKVYSIVVASLLVITIWGIKQNHIHRRPYEEKRFVIVIPSYNNADWYKQNLESVLSQDYDNYSVIYIDDHSTDATAQLVNEYLQKHDLSHRVRLLRNTKNFGALANVWNAVINTSDESIIVQLDGDDWLKDNQVLKRLNRAYADPNVWLTFGQYETYPQKIAAVCRPLPSYIILNQLYRNYEWVTTHLKTYYTWLFKQIILKDLLYDNCFFATTGDMAIMFPMLEMAGERSLFIPDTVYVYNRATPLSVNKVKQGKQQKMNHYIRSKPKYPSIAQCPQKKTPTFTILKPDDELKNVEKITTDYIVCARQNYHEDFLQSAASLLMQTGATLYDFTPRDCFDTAFPLGQYTAGIEAKNYSFIPDNFMIRSTLLKECSDYHKCREKLNGKSQYIIFATNKANYEILNEGVSL